MVLRGHRVRGMDDEDIPSPRQVPRMTTVGGAAATPYGSHIGTIAVGKAADLVLIDRDKLAYPYLDPETPVLDAILQRATSDGVDLVMVAGEMVYERPFHPHRSRRCAARVARIIAACAQRQRSRAAPALEGAAAACPAFLRRLFRSRSACALLPAKLAGMNDPGKASPSRATPPRASLRLIPPCFH